MWYKQDFQKQERFDEGQLTVANAKKTMKQDIDWDSKRVNVDSAKKIAVMQHMEYDGFAQMVLGANLKPSKAGQITSIYQGKTLDGNINPIASYNAINNFQEGEVGYDEEVVRRTLELNGAEELKAPETGEIFEKFLTKKLKETYQRYIYMRLIDFSQFEAIFKREFDAEVLLIIIGIFTDQVLNNPTFNNYDEQKFIARFLSCVGCTPKFEFTLDFLEECDREKIRYVIDNLDKLDDQEEGKAIKATLDKHFESL